jgi:hypothetical protein
LKNKYTLALANHLKLFNSHRLSLLSKNNYTLALAKHLKLIYLKNELPSLTFLKFPNFEIYVSTNKTDSCETPLQENLITNAKR